MGRLSGLWWWIDRWRKSSAYIDLTLSEQGAYRNLLDEAWLRGGAIPDNENVLAKACGDPRLWRKVKPKVIARFYLAADGWRNTTLDAVIAETHRRSDKQRRYRNGDGNDNGNGSGNGDGNEGVTSVVTARDLSDPDPDPDSSERSTASEIKLPGSRARSPVERVQRFMDRYRELHQQYIGVPYVGNDNANYTEACTLVNAFDDPMLDALMVYWLNDRDKFATEGTRTVAKLRSRASKYAEELKAKRLA